MADVAARAGVTKATVSYVINGRDGRVAEATRRRVLEAVDACGYQPNAAARALATKLTGNIGLILSDHVTGGWQNLYYSAILAAAERACRKHHRNLTVSLYNLSNLEQFVCPLKVRQRSVDGLILAGFVEAEVIRRFHTFGIPCICVGDNLEVAGHAVTVAQDIARNIEQAVRYLVGLGHCRIGYWWSVTRRGREVVAQATDRLEADGVVCHLQQLNAPDDPNDYRGGPILLDRVLEMSPDQRPTALIANDQVMATLLGEMRRRGLSCPKDFSLISATDSLLAQYAVPPLTSFAGMHDRAGEMAVNLLVAHLDRGMPLASHQFHTRPGEALVHRESCAVPRSMNSGSKPRESCSPVPN